MVLLSILCLSQDLPKLGIKVFSNRKIALKSKM